MNHLFMNHLFRQFTCLDFAWVYGSGFGRAQKDLFEKCGVNGRIQCRKEKMKEERKEIRNEGRREGRGRDGEREEGRTEGRTDKANKRKLETTGYEREEN